MKQLTRTILSLLFLTLASTQAYAAYGTAATTNNTSNGGINSATAATIETAGNQSSASIDLVTQSYTPILKAIATKNNPLNADDVAVSSAYGFQTFTYSGPATTIFLDLNLHGNIINNNIDPFASESYLRGKVQIIKNPIIRPDLINGTNCSAVNWNYLAAHAFDAKICGSKIAQNDTFFWEGDTNILNTLAFNVNAGDRFMVYASLQAVAFDGVVDGFNTFTMNFQDSTGLVADSQVSVPEASSIWLFVFGLLGVLALSRKNNITS